MNSMLSKFQNLTEYSRQKTGEDQKDINKQTWSYDLCKSSCFKFDSMKIKIVKLQNLIFP